MGHILSTVASTALGPDRRPLEGPRPQPAPFGTPSPGLSESARGTVSVPLSGTNIPAYLSTTAPTPPLPPNRGGPLQQSRAVARARAARNAHAAVMQAGIQARAQEALRHLQELNHQPDTASTAVAPAATSTTTTPRQAGASPVTGDTNPSTSIFTSLLSGAAGTTTSSQNAAGASTSATRQRPRMRHRPSEPPMAPDTLATRSPASASTPASAPSDAASTASGNRRPRAGAPRLASAVPTSSASEPSNPAPSRPTTSTTSTAANPDTSSQNEDRGFVLPPLNLSDPSLLEDHLSLGLLDPAMLLMSPPPAYTGRRSISSTRTMSTIGPSMGGGRRSERSVSPNSARSRGGVGFGGGLGLGGIGMEPIRSEESRSAEGEGATAVPSPRYSVPPSGSPPPPPSHARLSPPPPLTSSSEGEGGDQSDSASLNASSTGSADNAAASSSSDDDDDDDDDDASSFEVTSTDPLVLAWEADRSAGIYTLDERIARDLERRRVAAAQEEDDDDDPNNRQHQAAEHGTSAAAASSWGQRSAPGDSTQVVSSPAAGKESPPRDSRAGDQAAAAQATQSTAADDEEDLALLRRRISHAEASNNSRGVVRALSVHATRSLRAQGRMARERRGRAIPPSSASEEGGSPVAAASAEPLPVPETIIEREEAESHPELAPTVSQTPAPATTVPESEDRPARSLSLRGHRMLAEAAERRMRAEKENRLRATAAVQAQPAVAEEEEAEERLGGASIPAPTETVATTRATEEGIATSPQPTPARPRVAPPPPPPRSRPLSGDRSPAPAFASSSPSIAWGAAAAARPSQASLRRPSSIRRVPPPPPPNAAEILAARRASLRPVTANDIPSSAGSPSTFRTAPPVPSSEQPTPVVSAVAGESSSSPSGQPGMPSVHPHARANSVPPPSVSNASALPPAVPIVQPHARSASVAPASAPTPSSPPRPPRRRPLPVPPTSLGTDRVDAFTALRQSQGFGVADAGARPSLPAAVPTPENQRQPQAEAPSEPGPPLPRRPPRRDAPAPPVEAVVSSAPSQPAHSAAVGDATMPPPPSGEPSSARAVPSTTSTSEATRASQQPATVAAAAGEATGPLTPPLSPGLSMYTDLDLLLARLESQENGGDGAGRAEVHAAEGGDRDGAIPNGGQHYEVRPFPSPPLS